MSWWAWLLVYIAVGCAVAPFIGMWLAGSRERYEEEHAFWEMLEEAEMTDTYTATDTEEECPVTTLPKAWCQHCRVLDDTKRSHRLLGGRKRGMQPHHLT